MKNSCMIKFQIRVLMQTWNTLVVWILLLCATIANFIHNCISNTSMHFVSEMYDPVKMLTLSGWSTAGGILMYAYPLVLVIPTAVHFYNERTTKVNIYLQSRCGFRVYYYGNAIAVVILTFLIFTLPFLSELVLSLICSDKGAIRDPSGLQYYSVLPETNKILLFRIWLLSPPLYGVLMTIRFGLISSILSLFNYSIATSPRIKYKMLTMLPLISLLYLLMIIDRFIPVKLTYILTIPMFENTDVNELFWLVFLGVLLFFSIFILKVNEKKYYSLQK